MKKLVAVAVAVSIVGLAGCAGLVDKITGAQQKIAVVAQAIQPALIPACTAAMSLSAAAGPIAPWIVAGCGAAEAVDKLASDPSSTEWVNKLIGQAETVIAAAKHS